MKRIYYAKSDTKETIKEHTDRLLRNLKILKEEYSNEILNVKDIDKERFFYLLEIVCKYHDIGKVFTPFQNVILKTLGEKEIKTNFKYNIKHEQLSPIFVPIDKLGLSEEEMVLVYQSIFYHHERCYIDLDNRVISRIIEEDIIPQIQDIKDSIGVEINEELSPIYIRYVKKRYKEGDKYYNEYCMLKGLLHRLDHSSSAQLDVEDKTNENISDYTKQSLRNKGNDLNDIQKFTNINKNNNIVMIGSTGIGKTEAALIWCDNSKVFFTLPLRVSINAIYDRIRDNIKYEHIGLLHSTALEHIESRNSEELQEIKNEERIIEESENLFQKLTTCTIDQIFPFVFKYKGYEKIYSTLAYSKIIIDEIQAYSPEIVAIILKGIQMINNIGGKFMIMTATLPTIYKDKLEEMGIKVEYDKFLKNVKRHKIKIENEDILNDIGKIIDHAKNNKVLVIVNEVEQAKKIFTKIREKNENINVNLLHSQFIYSDRKIKEDEILSFSKDKMKTGIWITTQIVEASLDIDFDLLFTEMSTLDSLFQRLGRCYRSREYNKSEPNVYIYTESVSGIGEKSVYNQQIHDNSIKLLKEYDEKILEEEEKVNLVEKLYSKEMLEGTNFKKDFEEGLKVLNDLIDYDINKSKAQKLLRNIENINVIPKMIYEQEYDLFEEYNNCKDIKEKIKIKRKIQGLSISISKGKERKYQEYITSVPKMKSNEFKLIDLNYDFEYGLHFNQSKEDDLDSREF